MNKKKETPFSAVVEITLISLQGVVKAILYRGEIIREDRLQKMNTAASHHC